MEQRDRQHEYGLGSDGWSAVGPAGGGPQDDAAELSAAREREELARRAEELWLRFLRARTQTIGLLDSLRENTRQLRSTRSARRTGGAARAPHDAAPPTDPAALAGLTTREAEVARLLALGRTNAAIAAVLGISAHTARHHTESVMAKLGVHSRAAVAARLHGLLPSRDPLREARGA